MNGLRTSRMLVLCGLTLVVAALCALIGWQNSLMVARVSSTQGAPDTRTNQHEDVRASITFILGEDEPDGNQYYTEATNFYQYNEEQRAEILVTHCRSLVEMRDHLEENPPYNGLPWGTVNVVVHSNEWQDMGVAVVTEGERASIGTIEAAIDSGWFMPLPNEVLDSRTEMMVYGCGLGRNLPMLEILCSAFGGNDPERPIVRSSKYFVYYDSKKYNGQPYDCKRYMADFWHTDYPSFYHPGDGAIAQQLRTSYPDTDIDWSDALSRTQPNFPGDVFHFEFKVPLVWYVTYEHHTKRPELTSPEEEVGWVKEQEDLVAAVDGFGFEVDDFRWYVRKAVYEHGDGTREPAIKAIGFCSIVCVLKPMTEPGTEEPLSPKLADRRFYGQAGPFENLAVR